jgi:hypothetical protein
MYPPYVGHNQWQNLTKFDPSGASQEAADDHVRIPGQIVFVPEVTEEMIGINIGSAMIIPSQGLFTLIKLLEAPS